MIRTAYFILFYLTVPTFEQNAKTTTLKSPCPEVFNYEYEPAGTDRERWYGVVNLSTDTTLYWLWLNIMLDGKADILGNSIGEVTTKDNTNFRIEMSDMVLSPGQPMAVRFFVRYNPLYKIPMVQAIKLNGREICNKKTENLQYVDKLDTSESPQPEITPGSLPATVPVQDPPKVEVIEVPIDNVPSVTSSSSETTEVSYFQGSVPFVPNYDPLQGSAQWNQQSQCGKVYLNKPVPLVVEGMPTLEGQWPWQIALYQTQKLDNKYICGGTLVSHNHIITAAHCVTRPSSSRGVNPNTLTVYLGKYNLRTSVDGVQFRFVEKLIVNPEYDGQTYMNDIAILEVRESVVYNARVQPACLWPEDQVSLSNVIGQAGSVVGWGLTETGVSTEDLILVKMPVVDTVTCIKSNGDFFWRFTSQYTFCAGYRNGSSVCTGDSGGGMVFNKDDTWYLRGVVSLAVGNLAGDLPCDTSQYVIFTDVAKLLPWVKKNISY